MGRLVLLAPLFFLPGPLFTGGVLGEPPLGEPPLANYYEQGLFEEREGWNLLDSEQLFSPLLVKDPNAAPPVRIVINIPAGRLHFDDGEGGIKDYPISVGTVGYKTPTGSREIDTIVWNPWWLPPDSPWAAGEKPTPPGPNNPLGPAKMPLGESLLLHGTNKEQFIGQAASHGCVRMKKKDVIELAWFLQTHFSEKKEASYLDLYSRNRTQTFVTRLAKPVPVEVIYDPVRVVDDSLVVYPDIYGRRPPLFPMILEKLLSLGIDSRDINMEKLGPTLTPAKKVEIPLEELLL
ncbi:MAG: L,D-transpeptidase [Deltaproteobacteria bacterium]|nr:L,D-transpeptidase [Deltaproteobacteria bacterium]